MKEETHECQAQASSRPPLTIPETSARDGQRLFFDGRLKREFIRPVPDVVCVRHS